MCRWPGMNPGYSPLWIINLQLLSFVYVAQITDRSFATKTIVLLRSALARFTSILSWRACTTILQCSVEGASSKGDGTCASKPITVATESQC